MARHVQLRDLISDRFLAEIHHLLWTEPAAGETVVDGGWNCRDHAWVTALLALWLKFGAALASGAAFYAKGASARGSGASFTVSPHSWTLVEGVGSIDLSVKALHRIEGHDVPLRIRAVYAGSWIPRGRNSASFTTDEDEFARAIERPAPHRGHASSGYLIREVESVHAGHLTRAAGWIGSALTCRLDERYGQPSDLYAALFLHLRGFLDGTRASLVRLSPEQAWQRLAAEREGAIERALMHLGDRLESPKDAHPSPPVETTGSSLRGEQRSGASALHVRG